MTIKDSTASLPPTIKKLVRSLVAYEPEKIYLFGSYARGDWHDLSDIDLVLIKSTTRTFFERLHDIVPYLTLPVAIDVLIYTPEEFEHMLNTGNVFAETVMEEGIVVYAAEEKRGRGTEVVLAGEI